MFNLVLENYICEEMYFQLMLFMDIFVKKKGRFWPKKRPFLTKKSNEKSAQNTPAALENMPIFAEKKKPYLMIFAYKTSGETHIYIYIYYR